MKRLIFIALAILSLSATAAPRQEEIPERLRSEYFRLRALVEKLEPDFEVAGYLKGKTYGDHELLWHIEPGMQDAEVIRIYREKGDREQAFDVTFHYSTAIVRERTVIRRFVGPTFTGWRNDTMDVETGEYLGSQGTSFPHLDARDKQILGQWDIQLFE